VNNRLTITMLLFFSFYLSFSQKIKEGDLSIDTQSFLEDTESFNPLSPAKAAFYSAVVPGLGQAYNKRYWKIPVVYGALAIPAYYYFRERNKYNRFRKAFKLRKAGKTDEFVNTFTTESLESAQKIILRNRDSSLLIFIGLYALQILEASIDAHLLQFNISDKITFDPKLIQDPSTNKNTVGLSLNFNF